MGFREKLEQGNFVKILETVPPKGINLEKIFANLKNFKNKIDATTVVDSPLGIARMHPLPVAEKIQRELNIETVMHFICRDRNKIEIEAELLAASAVGIKNILALTGDPAKDGKAVFELNSIGLIDFIQKFNERHETDFFVGAGLNINADLETEMKRANRKIEAGAKFFITQPCFDAEKIKQWKKLKVPIITGILVVSDKKIFDYFSKVPGIKIPERLAGLVDDEEKIIDYYKKLIDDLEKVVAGVCLMPIGNYEIVKKII